MIVRDMSKIHQSLRIAAVQDEGSRGIVANQLKRTAVCAPSENIVAREIEGDILIVPLTSGIGNTEDELYTLNETGKAIWQRLDGKRTLQDVAKALSAEFDCIAEEIERDVIGLAEELLKRRILIEVSKI